MIAAAIAEPVLLVAGIAIIIAAGCAIVATVLGAGTVGLGRRPRPHWLEREQDLAAALGWSWPRWVALRLGLASMAALAGIATQVWLAAALLVTVTVFGVRFVVAGRAARRRLSMERAFLAQVRSLRDRMVIGNHSLDTALQEIGRNPGKELARVLAPWSELASIVDGIVESGRRSRSPIVEHCCAVLIWARTRSVDALISAIDEVLIPVGEAQLQVEEESLVALTQQRAVTFAMAALLVVMFAAIIRVDGFRAYYQSAAGTLTLLLAAAIFAALIACLGRIARVAEWTRWDLALVASQEARPHA